MKILLKSAKIIDPGSVHHQKTTDILIHNGKIGSIKPSIEEESARKIELEDLHVSPGWFDSSVGFGEPGYEERETIANGLRTAALSGFTDLILNPSTSPVTDTGSAVTSLLSRAAKHASRLYPSGALTKASEGKELAELFDMQNSGAVVFGDYKRPVTDANLLKIALQYTQGFDGLVQSFPQDEKIAGNGQVNEEINSTYLGLKGLPALAEELRISRDLFILEYTGGKLHIPTISTEGSVKLLKEAKKKGLDVTCSVAIHNLLLTDDELKEFDTRFKVLPPLRTKRDTKALVKGLKEGTIDMITCDHTPVDIEHKKTEFEYAMFGTIGLESAFGALMKIFGLEETISLLTKGRERFGLGRPEIREGAGAALSLFNPITENRFSLSDIHSSSKNSIFLNSTLKGKVYGSINGKHCSIQEK